MNIGCNHAQAVECFLEPKVVSDNADEVPHGVPNLVPKVVDPNFFADRARGAKIPGRKRRLRFLLVKKTLPHTCGRAMGEHESFKETVARKAISSV
jgi:hypothetical protein